MKISVNQYARLLLEIEGKRETEKNFKQEDFLMKLAVFIRKNKDLKKLGKIFDRYRQIKAEKEKTAVVEVESFSQLDERTKNLIKEIIARKYNYIESGIEIKSKINENLLGGMIVRIGNEIWDGSLRGKLGKIASAITS